MFISRTVFVAAIIMAPATVLAADGAALYAEHCAACHGANLEGEADWRVQNEDGSLPAPPHDDSGHTWHHADEMLRDYTRLGGAETLRRMGVTGVVSAMPAFGDVMSDEEIDAVLDFIKSNWSPQMRDHQRKITEASQ
ncbi:MAG: cytochrome c [Pseudomonadota bacterium]